MSVERFSENPSEQYSEQLQKIKKAVEGAKVGSVELIAFSGAIEDAVAKVAYHKSCRDKERDIDILRRAIIMDVIDRDIQHRHASIPGHYKLYHQFETMLEMLNIIFTKIPEAEAPEIFDDLYQIRGSLITHD